MWGGGLGRLGDKGHLDASEYVYDDLIRSSSLVDLRSRDINATSRSKCMYVYHSMRLDELNTMRPCKVL